MQQDAFNHGASALPIMKEMLLTAAADVWFRVLVKSTHSAKNLSYNWHHMTFCFRWDPERCSILCIGVGPLFQSLLQETLQRMEPLMQHSEPYSMLVPLIEAIVAMYDQSVWSVRDVIREAEKVSTAYLAQNAIDAELENVESLPPDRGAQ